VTADDAGADAAEGSRPPADGDGRDAFGDETRHFRGSTVLFFGRFIGLGLDLLTQIVIVRALTRTEFGAFAFGLAVASFAATVALVGMDKTISRFVPMYEEQGDQRRLAGAIVVAFGVVAGISAAMLLVLIGLRSSISDEVVESELARELLLILFLLAPLRAFDSLMTSTFAIFGSARSIVIRRNVVAPGLQLLVVVVVLATAQSPHVLAAGYVLAGAIGLTAFGWLLFKRLQRMGVVERVRRRDITLPARELIGFSLPLLSTDVVYLLRTSAIIVLLQYLATSDEVAAYSAVLPIARQNLIVYQSFAVLFVPVAARLFARAEGERLRMLYWQTSAWIAVATFPALVLSVPLASDVTVLLFGEAYRDSGIVLAVLAIGHYVSAAFGFNVMTLRVQGSIRIIVVADVLAAIISVGGSLLLIPVWGALGAAIATTATLIAQNVLYQVGLRRSSVGLPAAQHVAMYLAIAAAILVLTAIQVTLNPPLPIGIALGGMVWLGLLIGTRRPLDIGRYFPELRRVPVIRALVAPPQTSSLEDRPGDA
jgi:O-antigen/teichoic acid export membrane protein